MHFPHCAVDAQKSKSAPFFSERFCLYCYYTVFKDLYNRKEKSDNDLALKHLFGVACHVNGFVGVVDYEVSADELDLDILALFFLSVFNGGDSSGAGSRAARPCFARAALPHTHFYRVVVKHGDKLGVDSFGEQRVKLELGTD